MPVSREHSRAGSDNQLKVAAEAEHTITSQAWERFRQLPGQIDRSIEKQVEKGRLSPESPLW